MSKEDYIRDTISKHMSYLKNHIIIGRVKLEQNGNVFWSEIGNIMLNPEKVEEEKLQNNAIFRGKKSVPIVYIIESNKNNNKISNKIAVRGSIPYDTINSTKYRDTYFSILSKPHDKEKFNIHSDVLDLEGLCTTVIANGLKLGVQNE